MKALKKIWLVLGITAVVLVVAAICIPLFVDVDKYRPTLVQKANEYINGKLELGHLKLSLWGRVSVKIDGLKISDAKGKTVLSVKDAEIDIPLLSLITGSPELQFVLTEPAVNVVKFTNGKMNVMTLLKEQASATGSATGTPGGTTSGDATSSNSSATKSGATQIPSIVTKARFTFILNKAKLAYNDEISKDSYNINELDFFLKNVSLERDMPYEIKAQLDLLAQKKIKVVGPLILSGLIRFKQKEGQFASYETNGKLDLSGLSIKDPGMFDKATGVPLTLEWNVTGDKTSAQIPKLDFRIADLVIENKADAKFSEFNAVPVTTIQYSLKSNKIDVAKLGELLSVVKQYGMKGMVELAAEAHGPTTSLEYSAQTKFSGIELMNEAMLQPISVKGEIDIVTNKLKNLQVNLNAKNFDLAIQGMLENFLAPRFKFSVVSNSMDMDGLMKASEKAAEVRKEHAQATMKGNSTGATQAATAPVVDYNSMLAPLRENPIAAASSGSVSVSLKKIKATGVLIESMKAEFLLSNLLLQLKDFTMGIFGGSIKGAMSFNAKPLKPEVGTQLTVTNLDTQKMIESQMPFARNTLKGIISAQTNIGGSGLNPAEVISGWKGGGSMSVVKASANSMDFGPKIKAEVSDKLPPFAKEKVKIPDSLVNWKGDYDSLVIKFALSQGVFNITDITGKAYPQKGLDLKGAGIVNLKDYALDLGLDLIDTYNMMNLEQYAKDKRYGKFTLSPRVKGTMFEPKFDWGSTMSKLAQGAVQGKAKEELLKAVGGKIPGAGGDAVNKLFGGGNKQADGGGSSAPAPQPPKVEDVKNKLKGLFGR